MTRVEFVPATKELVESFYGEPQQVTIRAVAAVRDGKVLGIAGVHRMGMGYGLFSDLSDEFLRNRRDVVRGLHEVEKITRSLKMTLYAKAQDPDNTVLIDRLGATLWHS